MAIWKEFTKRKGGLLAHEVTSVLLEGRTRFQEIGVYDTVRYGRALYLDGEIQSAERDEFIYHEALAHPALLLHPNPRRVMIAGGGEGATLREVLRHPTVEQAVMVDLDDEVVAAARQYLQPWHAGAFEDPRTELRHEDARAYLESADSFDTILVDITDPLAGGPSYRLFTTEFYQLVMSRLTPGGTIGIQAESADMTLLEIHLAILRTVASVFPVARAYHDFVPSFAEPWGFVVAVKPDAAGQVVDPAALTPAEVDELIRSRGLAGLRYYDGETHRRLFSQPKYEREAILDVDRIITDDNPLVIT